RTGAVWIYATIGGLAARASVLVSAATWDDGAWIGAELQRLTFRSVQLLMGAFYPVTADAATLTISTGKFDLIIGGACSGIEGLGLILIFVSIWLWVERRDVRFPHVLLLVPVALATIWVANILRIIGLVVIGHLGAEEI